ncbi:MAG: Dabb family protein [Planctomycetaceae bacterium]|nr:Dabb family protein [Planctomycetaceae bacterium]
MLSHMVYFTLNDASEDACRKLVEDCHKFLKPHAGIVFYAAGTLAPEFDRPVNDQNFNVALHVVFDTKESHDAYQVSESHLQFIAQNKETWKQVRVFDAYVASGH